MGEVALRDVRKAFGEVAVVHGVSCSVADGEFLVVLGPSGCGKSTLLRMIAGLETVTSGEIAINGATITDREPRDRNIAMVFQNYALYPHMSVFDNMAYGLRIRGLPRGDIAARVEKAAAVLELGSLLQRKPRQLSGGQRQRVAMGRALVRDPAVFLFDEPLSNLDAKLRGQMRIELKRLHRELKTTAIYVTHDQVEAMTLADRLLVMNAGRVEQLDTPLAVYDRPASIFVAGFIGAPAMNLLEGAIAPDGQSIALAGGSGPALHLTLPQPRSADGGRPIVLGVRPEHLVRSSEPGTGLDMKVDLVEALGADGLVHGKLANGQRMTMRVAGAPSQSPGDAVTVTVPPAQRHVFDAATGRRIEALG